MKAKLKNWLKAVDANFPSLRFLVRKFPFIATVAKAAGLASPEAIKWVTGGLFSNCSVDGFPGSSVFDAGFLKGNIYLLMGVTNNHPVLDKILVKVSAVDDNENTIYKHAPVVLTNEPVVAPEVVRSMLPDYIAWFQMHFPDLPVNFKRVSVRYSSGGFMDLKTQPVPRGFRFCNLIINRLNEGDDGHSVFNLDTCSPIVIRPIKA